MAQWWCGSGSVKCLMAHSAATDMMMLIAAKTNATRTCLLIVEPSIFCTCHGECDRSRPERPGVATQPGETPKPYMNSSSWCAAVPGRRVLGVQGDGWSSPPCSSQRR